MSEVILKKLTKVYGGTTVVDHIDLTVPDGTLTSILGPSGCGKTTTLRMIAGFETPESGDVLFDGVSVSKVPVNQRGIGMVFQSYALRHSSSKRTLGRITNARANATRCC